MSLVEIKLTLLTKIPLFRAHFSKAAKCLSLVEFYVIILISFWDTYVLDLAGFDGSLPTAPKTK